MDDKMIADLAATMRDIRDKLSTSSIGYIRGPVADPAPDWPGGGWPGWPGGTGPIIGGRLGHLRGPIADPAPWHLLDKVRIAKLKIKQIEMEMDELARQMDFLKLQKDLLKQEYKLK